MPGPCDPEDLLDGVVFGAKYMGSTQLKSEKNPSTNARMAQAQEAVDRIKVKSNKRRQANLCVLTCLMVFLCVIIPVRDFFHTETDEMLSSGW